MAARSGAASAGSDSMLPGASGFGQWTRPGDLASGFGAGPAARAATGPQGVGSAFDVCHVGVVLRAVLGAQVVVGLALMHTAASFDTWLAADARLALATLWATLIWLAVACAGKRWFARASVTGQWLIAGGLGAACAAVADAVLQGLWPLAAPSLVLAAPATGFALAATLYYWLRQRMAARTPADADARLAELQSRIRPHFLFNTLNSAVALVQLDPAKAEAVLEDLAELFRVALSEAGESVTLAEEVELARRYLAIESVRFGPRLRVSWDVDSRGGAARVPPLLLQPLVENAVRHGVEPSAEGADVRVRTRVRRGHVLVDIVNTLPDLPSAPGHGMALHNVRERLRLMHDVAGQFEARRDGDVYRVRLVVPLEAP